MLVLEVLKDGRTGAVRGLARISNIDAGNVERADAHGIRVRRKRLRPERGAESPSESERGWGPASAENNSTIPRAPGERARSGEAL
jgi:hypothetical protein